MSALALHKIPEPATRLHCSFCGKNDRRLRFLVGGKAGGTICNTCCFTSVFIFLRAYIAAIRLCKG